MYEQYEENRERDYGKLWSKDNGIERYTIFRNDTREGNI